MLSSIHPLGERTRNNKWALTVAGFTVGSTVTAALVGAGLGWLGGFTFGNMSETVTLVSMAVIVALAGLLDASGVTVPGPRRQVNEHWIGAYRGWVYGGAFGVQLGAGVATFVVTWGVYATLALELVSASPVSGALIGSVFGAGRSIGLFLAGRVDRASRLSAFHGRMATLGPPVRVFAGYAPVVLGCLAVGVVLL